MDFVKLCRQRPLSGREVVQIRRVKRGKESHLCKSSGINRLLRRTFLVQNDTNNALLGAGERDWERKYTQGKFRKSRGSPQIFSLTINKLPMAAVNTSASCGHIWFNFQELFNFYCGPKLDRDFSVRSSNSNSRTDLPASVKFWEAESWNKAPKFKISLDCLRMGRSHRPSRDLSETRSLAKYLALDSQDWNFQFVKVGTPSEIWRQQEDKHLLL